MSARRFAAAVLVGVILWAAGIVAVLWLTGTFSQEKPSQLERIEEDDPRWDCTTMGNGECGDARAA